MARSITTAEIIHREELTPSLAVFHFRPENGIEDFAAGQFTTLGMPHPEKEGKTLWRAYSIASEPEQKDHLELYIRLAERPVPGVFTTWLWDKKVGDSVACRQPPTGHFTLVNTFPDGKPDQRRKIFLGGGTGIAPFISMARHLQHAGHEESILIFHGCSYLSELGYRDELTALAKADPLLDYHATISRPQEEVNAGWEGLGGRVESVVQPDEKGWSAAERIAGEQFTPENSSFYICGFGGTVDAVTQAVEDRGFVSKKNRRPDGSYDIHAESYG